MRSVEQVPLKEMPERPHRLGSYRNRGVRGRYISDRAGSWIAELGIVSHETTLKKVSRQVSNWETSRQEVRRLVAQCSILVVIAGIVAGLIAA
jgi:hypothetical protein